MDYWMIKTGDGPGIDGGLMARQHQGQPANNAISVPSVDDAGRAIVGAGGREVVEGTVFGVMQFDEQAR